MTWGAYWMFYECPLCQAKFKSATESIQEDSFGKCPSCKAEGILVAENNNAPKDFNDYKDTAD